MVVPVAAPILAAPIDAAKVPPPALAIVPIRDNIFFVYCAPDIFLENMLYVSGTENTAKVIIDVIALLLNIFASCLVAAAPEIAAFPEHGSNRIDNILCCFKSQRFYQIGTKRYKLFC